MLESRISFLNAELRCFLDIRMEVSEKQSKILVYSRNCELEMEKGPGRALRPHVHGVLGLSFAALVNGLLTSSSLCRPTIQRAVLSSAQHLTRPKPRCWLARAPVWSLWGNPLLANSGFSGTLCMWLSEWALFLGWLWSRSCF